MDNFLLLVCLGGFVIFVVLIAALKSAARSFHVRPGQDEVVQLTWSQRESLERSSISGSFWKFIAKLEFFLLLGAAIWIWILTSLH